MGNQSGRLNNLSKEDKLWELYLHTLAGFHGNLGANKKELSELSKEALIAAKNALKVWEEDT